MTIFGDTSGDLGGIRHAAGQEILSRDPFDLTIVGDSRTLLDTAVGGNDKLAGPGTFGIGPSTVIGDAFPIPDLARGGNDEVSGTTGFGDALTLSGFARGGNDTVSTGALPRVNSFAYGDARAIT